MVSPSTSEHQGITVDARVHTGDRRLSVALFADGATEAPKALNRVRINYAQPTQRIDVAQDDETKAFWTSPAGRKSRGAWPSRDES